MYQIVLKTIYENGKDYDVFCVLITNRYKELAWFTVLGNAELFLWKVVKAKEYYNWITKETVKNPYIKEASRDEFKHAE